MTDDRDNKNLQEQFISLATLARRWQVSVTGARTICDRVGIESYYLGGVPRGTRRFRLQDIEEYERSSRA
jgi:hypothetical protein